MRPYAFVIILALFVTACQPAAEAPAPEPPSPNVVDLVARDLTFDGPSEIPSGWTTIRFSNMSGMVHFAVIQQFPDSVTTADHQALVAPAFQAGMDRLAEGDVDGAMAAFGELPPWFGEIVFQGGPGLVSAGGVTEVTVNLEPGSYMFECYVKTGGIFHSYNPDPDTWGMVHPFTVTDAASDHAEPQATARVSVSAEAGFSGDLALVAGEHVVAVQFADQGPHENFVGHDIHLVRLADDTDLAAVEAWMDWRSPTGLETPSPVQFVGGVNEMPAGSVSYLHLSLDPGRYAWIAEVPGASGKGMLVEFEATASAM